MSLSGSVGLGGRNHEGDVTQVQELLNDNGAKPRLRVDGACGRKTIAAVRWFQQTVVRMASPDGRVDPNGRTWRALSERDGRDPKKTAPKRNAASPVERRAFRDERRTFVDPRVKENGTTTRIIDALLPHLRGTDLQVISGWLSDSDLFWKVNYHWEYLLWMVEHCISLDIDDRTRRALQTTRSKLLAVPPQPRSGYRTSASVGKPVDSSDAKTMTKRHAVVSQEKRAFKNLTREARLAARSRRPVSTFHLAAAPVAHPGTSKHSTGYALDVKGPAGTVKSICKRVGATLVFDEKSHTHVEFKNGVKPAR